MCPARYDLAISTSYTLEAMGCCCVAITPQTHLALTTTKLSRNYIRDSAQPSLESHGVGHKLPNHFFLFASRWPSSIVADTFNSSAPSSPGYKSGVSTEGQCQRTLSANSAFDRVAVFFPATRGNLPHKTNELQSSDLTGNRTPVYSLRNCRPSR